MFVMPRFVHPEQIPSSILKTPLYESTVNSSAFGGKKLDNNSNKWPKHGGQASFQVHTEVLQNLPNSSAAISYQRFLDYSLLVKCAKCLVVNIKSQVKNEILVEGFSNPRSSILVIICVMIWYKLSSIEPQRSLCFIDISTTIQTWKATSVNL